MVLRGTEATTQEQLNKKFIELAQEKEAPAYWMGKFLTRQDDRMRSKLDNLPRGIDFT